MLRANAPDKIVEAWKQEAFDRPTIVFTPTVSVAKAVAEAFNGAEVPAAWVSGAMPIRGSPRGAGGIQAGRIRVVANCAVLTEGFDEPSVSCIVVARPTMNETLYIQMVGRGTRLYPGKAECLVLDMVGCADQLQLDAVVALGGKKPEPKKEPAPELLDTEKKQPGDVPFTTADGVLVARAPKPRPPVCRWVDLGAGWCALSLLSDGWIVIRPDSEGAHTILHWKNGKTAVTHERLDAMSAKSFGEADAKAIGALGPMRWGNPWLDRPISEKQLAFGHKLGLPITSETTSWEFTKLQAERLHQRWRA
jgi:ATP-dependent helicase IRC3